MCAQPIINPALPFVGAIPGGLQPGRMIRVSGVAHPTARCFSINLQCGPGSTSQDDIALHLSPVFSPPPRLVRNSLQNQQWGPEESHGPYFPFVVGQHFEILILTEGDEYKIAVNGQHFCEFKHRIPIYRVTSLSVNGDATINEIKYEGTVSPLGGMQQPSAGGFSGGFLPPPGMPTATSPSCPSAYSVPNPPSPTPYGQQPYPTQSGVPYQPNPYGAPPLPPGSNPYGTPPVPPGSNPYGTSPYGTSPYGVPQGNYPQSSKSGGLGSLLPSGLAAGIGALTGSALLGKGMQDSGKRENNAISATALKAGIGLLTDAAISTAKPKAEREGIADQMHKCGEGKGKNSNAADAALAVGVGLLANAALSSMNKSKERESTDDQIYKYDEGKGKNSNAADAALAVGVGILTNAALSSINESKHKDKDEQLSSFAAGIGKLAEAAVVSVTEQKHHGDTGKSSLASSALSAGVEMLADTAASSYANSIKHGGYPGYPYGKPKSSSPIPIGLAAGAGALAGAAMLGKSPLKIGKKMKKLYKHKGFKHKGFKHKGWHMGGWHSSSSSSSSEEE